MISDDVGQTILLEIRRLGERMSSMETRMGALETRMGALETRMDALEARMGAVETRLDALEARMGAVETRMDALETRVGAVETRMDALETHMGALETRVGAIETDIAGLKQDVGELKQKFNSWPDMHFLTAAARIQLEHSKRVQDEVVDLKTKINEIFGHMATGPEIRVLREEMSHYREKSIETDLRLGTIEGHLGIVHDFQPN